MGFFRDYKYSSTQVTAIASDTNGGNFVWVAFKASGGNCLLLKVSATDLNQVYFTVVVPVSSINDMLVVNGYIFLAVTHPSIFSIAYSVSQPLTTFVTSAYPAGVTESPVVLTVDGSNNVYFLTPGLSAGTYATIVEVTSLNVLVQAIVLAQTPIFISNASSFTIDGSSNFWVITANQPGVLCRVWFTSVWNLQQTSLM